MDFMVDHEKKIIFDISTYELAAKQNQTDCITRRNEQMIRLIHTRCT